MELSQETKIGEHTLGFWKDGNALVAYLRGDVNGPEATKIADFVLPYFEKRRLVVLCDYREMGEISTEARGIWTSARYRDVGTQTHCQMGIVGSTLLTRTAFRLLMTGLNLITSRDFHGSFFDDMESAADWARTL